MNHSIRNEETDTEEKRIKLIEHSNINETRLKMKLVRTCFRLYVN